MWITSWFDDLETDEQFKDSLHKFELFFVSKKDVIGNHYSVEITEIKNIVVANIQHTGNHLFITRCTLNVQAIVI